MTYTNCHHAIRDANAQGTTCVGWLPARSVWVLYPATSGAPIGVEPELLCLRSGCLPIALSETGQSILEYLR